MGASYIEHEFDQKHNRDSVYKNMRRLQDEATEESGTSYSGDLGSAPSGVRFSGKAFDSYDKANAWLSDNQEKWEQPMAVQYRLPVKSKKLDKLKQKQYDLRTLMSATKRHRTPTATIGYQVVERIKSQSSKFKACNECNSKIAVSYLKFGECPVCSCKTAFFTAGDNKKVESLQKKIDKIELDLDNVDQQIETLAAQSTDMKWLVGCWCSS